MSLDHILTRKKFIKMSFQLTSLLSTQNIYRMGKQSLVAVTRHTVYQAEEPNAMQKPCPSNRDSLCRPM